MRTFLLFVHHVRALLLLATAVGVVAGLGCVGGGECGCGADDDEGGPDNPVVPGGGGGSYESVVIGGQKWMKRNLNIATPSGSRCYDNDPSNCEIYGRLYNWNTAKTICPTGWHLPSRGEWDVLAQAVGGWKYEDSWPDRHIWEDAGRVLKSTSGWYDWDGNNSGNGTDAYGFSALPGGGSHDKFGYAGYRGVWWTATEYSDGNAYFRAMVNSINDLSEDNGDKDTSISVRCVGD